MRIGRAPAAIGLRVAAIVSLVEGLALVGYGMYLVIELARLGLTGPAEVSNVPSVSLEILMFLAFGAGLLVVARGLWSRRRWARAPLVVAQIFALVVGVPLVTAEGNAERTVGILVVILALAALIGVFLPSTTRSLVDGGR